MFQIFGHTLNISQMSFALMSILLLLLIFAQLFVREKAKFVAFSFLFVCCFVFFVPIKNGKIHTINLTFSALTRYNVGHNIQNILLYLPLAFFFELAYDKKAIVTTGLVFFSLLCESLQFFIQGRVCDINDLLMNTFGTVVGVFLAHLLAFDKRQGNKPSFDRQQLQKKHNVAIG